MFGQITNNPVLKDKTFIITANNYKVLDYADRVVFMEHGRILFNGSVEEFKKSKIDPNLAIYLNGKTKNEQ